ncbi:MAG: ABC-2 transporter permease [Gammaproteobacteria bacterium]|nr:ABC-2 transporter permease [Gammaproteobacteria bacterium]MDH3410049.1 ABC-2 transporter permease [Gammaproteobacteria bacterium]MDH3551822.1 ABC-2 transporter permease [Gammaproteobacteria bacterium]
MIAHQLALVRRELWEHRSIFITPAAVGLVVTLLVITAYVAASGFGGHVDIAIITAQNVGETERRAALMAFLAGITSVFILAAGILTIFYCLDTLYAERKDKSILFWRSLPVTDAETVISKLLTAAFAIPLITFAAIVVAHLVNLVVSSIFVSIEGGSAARLIWGSVPIFDVWTFFLVLLIATPLWLSPFIGWFLFVSAWTKRSPLLTAFLPLLIVPMLEYFILRTTYLWEAIITRTGSLPLFRIADVSVFDEDSLRDMTADSVSLLAIVDIFKFISHPGFWIGLVVCGLFTTAAIYVRRYRDES